jgi:small subunit ribosomal protein S21
MDSRFKGLEVKPRQNEDPDRFIKRFMKKVRSDGVLQEVYLRRAYEKPSVKRRRKRAQARFLKKVENRP